MAGLACSSSFSPPCSVDSPASSTPEFGPTFWRAEFWAIEISRNSRERENLRFDLITVEELKSGEFFFTSFDGALHTIHYLSGSESHILEEALNASKIGKKKRVSLERKWKRESERGRVWLPTIALELKLNIAFWMNWKFFFQTKQSPNYHRRQIEYRLWKGPKRPKRRSHP